MTVFLEGLRLGGYRGIGAPQDIGPLKRFNFFAGANNSGKSTVLSFLSKYATQLSHPQGKPIRLDVIETHGLDGGTQPNVAFGITRGQLKHGLGDLEGVIFEGNETAVEFILGLSGSEEIAWFSADQASQNKFKFFTNLDVEKLALATKNWNWERIWRHLTKMQGGSLRETWIPQTLSVLDANFSFELPPIYILPAIRQISQEGKIFEGLSGAGLIEKLQSLQNPEILKQDDRSKFEAINRLLATVLNKPDARLEIPYNKEAVIVHMDDKALPLSSLGTGIEEVILIGAYCTIYDNSIMCLEEPELHLHPILQRQLLRYLHDETSSQYFISTHSAAFIDMPEGQIFQVENDGTQTTIHSVTARASRRLLSDRLGYRASDVVQANSVVWVEGPSDRIYVKQWLRQVDPELVEGIDYSIMFYGGRLLNHLTGEADLIDDFINLKALNQNSAIILDSDRPAKGAKVNATKQRIVSEYKNHAGFAWVTKGREIENYLDPDHLHATLQAVHPKSYKRKEVGGDYDNRMNCLTAEGTEPLKTADKVKVAQTLVEDELNLDILDLREQVSALAKFIRKANHI